MKTASTITWMLTAAAAALAFAACGTGQEGEADPTLGTYEAPLTSADDGTEYCANPHKVLICHVPPGNPDNAHSICVGAPAQPAHLNHGDALGACSSDGVGDDADGGELEEGGGDNGGDIDAGTGGDGGTIN